jgi:hypothetical protein
MFVDFLKMLGIALGIIWALLIPLLYFFARAVLIREVLTGCFLPVVCFVLSFYAVSWAVHRPLRPFMITVFGGMLIRLLLIGATFVLLVKLAQFDASSLLFSLIGFYTLCLAVELYFVSNRIRCREEVQE